MRHLVNSDIDLFSIDGAGVDFDQSLAILGLAPLRIIVVCTCLQYPIVCGWKSRVYSEHLVWSLRVVLDHHAVGCVFAEVEVGGEGEDTRELRGFTRDVRRFHGYGR